MADSLDDFFAKKDKKSRTKKKFSSADEIAKQLEDSGKDGKVKKEKEKTNQSSSFLTQNDDEWEDFNQEKDYSGLRIQSLNFREIEEEEREQQKVQEIEDNKREESGSAWKLQQNENGNEVDEENNDDGEAKRLDKTSSENSAMSETSLVTSATSTKSSAYVPPHLRDKKPSSGLQPGFRNRMKNAPEINNELEFPSLGNESLDSDFKYVKHGSKSVIDNNDSTAINLGNKFNALSDGN